MPKESLVIAVRGINHVTLILVITVNLKHPKCRFDRAAGRLPGYVEWITGYGCSINVPIINTYCALCLLGIAGLWEPLLHLPPSSNYACRLHQSCNLRVPSR